MVWLLMEDADKSSIKMSDISFTAKYVLDRVEWTIVLSQTALRRSDAQKQIPQNIIALACSVVSLVVNVMIEKCSIK